MLLIGVKEENGWLLSTFNLTFPASWNQILKATTSLFDYYDDLEILINNTKINISKKKDINKLKEASNLTIRGLSRIIKAPMSITFFNQARTVNVSVAQTTDEFMVCDYQKFNMSLGQLMDSIELMMHH